MCIDFDALIIHGFAWKSLISCVPEIFMISEHLMIYLLFTLFLLD